MMGKSNNQDFSKTERGILTGITITVFTGIIYFLFTMFSDHQVGAFYSAIISVGATMFIVYVIMGIMGIVKAFSFKAGPLSGSANFEERIEKLGTSVRDLNKQVRDIARKEIKKVLEKHGLSTNRLQHAQTLHISPETKNDIEKLYKYLKKSDEIENRLSEDIPNVTPSLQSIEEIMEQALVSYYDEEYDEALKLYEQVLDKEGNNADALYNKGLVFDKQGKYDEALKCFKKADEIRPDDPDTLYNIGLMYGKLENFQVEEQYYDQALKIDPDHLVSIYNKACNRAMEKKADEAIKLLKNIISKDPSFKETAKNDKDLDNIRLEPEFQKLIK